MGFWASVSAADRTLDHLLQRLLTEENVVKSYQKTDNVTEGAFVASEGANRKYTTDRGGYPGVRGRGKKHLGIRGGYVDKRSRQQNRADQDQRPKCEYCTKPGHQEKDCYKKHGYPYVGGGGKTSTGLLSLSNPTLHFTNPGIGNSKLDVRGTGSINVTTVINQIKTSNTLMEVLYLPGLGVNLFSIGAATA
jgi:hypothetical protein